jgi:TM2 domain-containing membrane protein YozV
MMEEEKLETVPCPYCRGVILVGAKRCKYCHAELAGMWLKEAADKRPEKNPALATLLSLFFPGMGQYYCGRTDKAVVFVFLFVIFVGLFYWLTFPWVLVAVGAGVDAFLEARKTRQT